jgi:hypothetical protein
MDSTHRLCVHTRRGDFLRRNWQSNKEETKKFIEFCVAKLQHEKGGQISLILLGDDKEFLRNLNIDKNVKIKF